MSDTTPRQDEDTTGHAYSISDPGEVPTEGGRGRLPMPGDEDDAQGHVAVRATSDGTEDDTEGHLTMAATDDGTEDDTQGHTLQATDDGTEQDQRREGFKSL